MSIAFRMPVLLQGWTGCVLRFVLTYAALTWFFHESGETYSRWWCGGIREMLTWIVKVIATESVDVQSMDGEHVFRMQGVTLQPLHAPEGRIPVGTVAESATLQGYAHLHAVLIASLLMLWPVQRASRRLLLLASGMPAIVLATLLDIPFVLAGAVLSGVHTEMGHRFDVLSFYYRFLEQGGRPLLSLALGVLALVASMDPDRMQGRFTRVSDVFYRPRLHAK